MRRRIEIAPLDQSPALTDSAHICLHQVGEVLERTQAQAAFVNICQQRRVECDILPKVVRQVGGMLSALPGAVQDNVVGRIGAQLLVGIGLRIVDHVVGQTAHHFHGIFAAGGEHLGAL